VELGGEAVRVVNQDEGPPAEAIGLLAALVILVLMFGSLLAASLPLVIAIFAVGRSLGPVVLASHVATVADFTPYVMTLVGLVGGRAAAAGDFADEIAERMPVFVAVVVGLSALLLLIVFRSLLIPLKAAVLNLLSIGASLGVLTLVFQEGMLGDLIGIEPGPIEAFVPVMIFAIIFVLSMDYEIFLLSRMHEEWERRHDPAGAIREGLATTGRVVTAAAAIMIVVFGAFLVSPDRMLKQFGLGLSVAIFIDAVVI